MRVYVILLVPIIGACQAELKNKLNIDGTDYDLQCNLDRYTLEQCIISCKSEKYCALRNVPYAKAARFRRPELLTRDERRIRRETWTKDTSGCMQIDPFEGKVAGEEDCLVVDLYIPHLFFENNDPWPLVVILEGFEMKSYLAPHLSPTHGPFDFGYVLAVVHYRVGVLGFLTLENELAPPNLGLFDQQLALQFLNNTASVLRTAPGTTVLFGFGSGAASVTLHMANPVSRNLFTRALISGGSALSPDATVFRPYNNALVLAKELNCSTANKESIFQCLNEKNASTLIETASMASLSVRFAAFIDGTENASDSSGPYETTFINGPISELFNGQGFGEGMEVVAYGYPARAGLSHFLKSYDTAAATDPIKYLERLFGEYEAHESSKIGVSNAAYQHYFGQDTSGSPVDLSQKPNEIVDMLTDYLVGGPSQGAILSSFRKRTEQSTILSFVFIPGDGSGGPILETNLSLAANLYETKNKLEDLSKDIKISSYGTLMDDLLIFIGCNKVPPFITASKALIDSTIRAAASGQNLKNVVYCLLYNVDDFCNPKVEPREGNILFKNQVSLPSTLQPNINKDPQQVYRSNHNHFWMSIRPLVMDFEKALYTESEANRKEVVQTAGSTVWGLVAGIIVMTIIAVIMTLVVVKLVIDRRRDAFETGGVTTRARFTPTTETVTTSP